MIKIIWHEQNSNDDLGGKGNTLQKLISYGVNVPSFFSLKLNGNTLKINELDNNSISIRNELKQLGSPPWAVRSSAIGEDSRIASFAGMFKTFLAIYSPDELLEAIKNCFDSINAEKVIQYSGAKDINIPTKMCVLVQRFINPIASGVAFSRHPTQTKRKIVWIEGNYGIGTTVVNGYVTPDRWIIEWNLENIINVSIGSKRFKDVVIDKKICQINTPSEERAKQCISDEIVIRLSIVVKNIDNLFGYPVDVEWIWDGESVVIIQSRPITVQLLNKNE